MKSIVLSVIWMLMGGLPMVAQTSPMDYSFCGYRMSETEIPVVETKVFVSWHEGDQSARIQKAIDAVASMKPDKKTGFRGAVVLDRGTFELTEPLRLHTAGVVLRGVSKKETVLLKKGCDRGALVYIEGKADLRVTDTLEVASAYVAAGESMLAVKGGLHAGDEVILQRPSTKEWIASLGCENFGGGKDLGYWAWHPGDIDVAWHRTIKEVRGNNIVLDAPLSAAIDQQWGGAKVIRYTWNGRVHDAGVENLTLASDYNRQYPKDEDHCWNGVYIAAARDCWVRMVDFRHFSGSAVIVQRNADQITVEDCISKEPVSEIGGYRRCTFYTMGGKCLFQRCYSEQGIHDFAAGIVAPGPNAFVQCDAKEALGFSGSIGSWATGLLFDNVNIEGNDLKCCFLGIEKYGAGWNTANSLMYQCTASGIYCDSVSIDANNVAYGCWAQFCGTGRFYESNNHVKPWSIFAELLGRRLNRDVSAQCRVLERNTGASSSPTIEEAVRMTEEARLPRQTLEEWIEKRCFDPVPTTAGKEIGTVSGRVSPNGNVVRPTVQDGKLVSDGALLVGGKYQTPWWNGKVKYNAIATARPAVTRFVPGMEGCGLTDRIDSVVEQMERSNMLLFSQNYGLWYDRRRDDHERVKRRDGDVWGPFYEQPFARSGEGTAWDGLSKYDLTRLNPWYYNRLRQFAAKGRAKGLILFNEHYFQHNILEAGAHWVDCPWRSANNINNTDFPEPVPFTGDKRIFMAEYFYDVNHPVRRALHRQYIMQTLDAFADCPNVIHSIGEEFTGPLSFVRFWLDTIREWEEQNGKNVLVALAVTKDVQDSVLADAQRAQVVDIIDVEQWFYHNKGLYAPEGGVNMAPRQYLRKMRPGSVRFEDVYRSVSEYRQLYPDKAVVYYAQKFPEMAWAVLMAGGSFPAIPVKDQAFLQAVSKMKETAIIDGNYVLGNGETGLLTYVTGGSLQLALPKGSYFIHKVNASTGEITPSGQKKLSEGVILKEKGIYWLQRKR